MSSSTCSARPTEADKHIDTLERCIDNKLWTPPWMLRQWRDHIAAATAEVERLRTENALLKAQLAMLQLAMLSH